MASESNEDLAPPALLSRRVDTPPRSIFADYRSAYQSITSPDRSSKDAKRGADTADTPKSGADIWTAVSPTPDLPSSRHCFEPSSDLEEPNTVAEQGQSHISPLTSPDLKQDTDCPRPTKFLTSSKNPGNPAKAMIINSSTMRSFNIISQTNETKSFPASLSSSQRADYKIGPSNFGGDVAESGTESSDGRLIKNDSYKSDVERRSVANENDPIPRSPFDTIKRGASLRGSSIDFPLGETPSFPLSLDQSRVVYRGSTTDVQSKASLYEDIEKLLSLAQNRGISLPSRQTEPEEAYGAGHEQNILLNGEFSWMVEKGRSSFHDVSVKEMRQLCAHKNGEESDRPGSSVQLKSDKSHDEHYLLSDAVYQHETPAQLSDFRNIFTDVNTWRARTLSNYSRERLANPVQEKWVAGYQKPDAGEHENHTSSMRFSELPEDDIQIESGGSQSSSSRKDSPDFSLTGRPRRAGLCMNGTSLASLEIHEPADITQCSTAAKRKWVIREPKDDEKENSLTEIDESEDGEWETVREGGSHRKFEPQRSLDRDTSGSSLANLSSNRSSGAYTPAPLPWDPLRPSPLKITPPREAIIHTYGDYISGAQEPSTVPKAGAVVSRNNTREKLDRMLSSIPALELSASPRHQPKLRIPAMYRHPTPLVREHQNPFRSPPPPTDAETQGASYELADFKNREHSCGNQYSPSRLHTTQEDTLAFDSPHSNFTFPRDTVSSKSMDESYSNTDHTYLGAEDCSILSPNSSQTPKSTGFYTPGSLKRTKAFFTGSPNHRMVETQRYRRVREEMGCSTSGIVRVPGMQLVAPPQAHVPEEFIGLTKPFRAAHQPPDPPQSNGFALSPLELSPLDLEPVNIPDEEREVDKMEECPIFPIRDEALKRYFPNSDSALSDKPRAERGTAIERDGQRFEKAFCDKHQRWEFSYTPRLTRRIPQEFVKTQHELGNQILLISFCSVFGWPFLVSLIAWDPGDVRNDIMREYSKGVCQTFHQEEVSRARALSMVVLAIAVVALALVAALLE